MLTASPPSAEAIESAWRRVQLARHPQRPRTLDLVALIFDDFAELHGDRSFRDDPAIVGGPALLDGRPVMVIGHQKGKDTESNILRNFGSPYPEGFRKAQRLMRLADKLGAAAGHLPRHGRRLPRSGRGGARPGRGDRLVDQADDRAPGADRGRHHRRGGIRRRAGDRRRGRGAGARERHLLGDLARGLRGHPVARPGGGADGRGGDAHDRRRPARAGHRSTA